MKARTLLANVDSVKMNQWPSLERPREKLLAQGAKTLSDAELLAILLQIGTRGKTALDLARDLLRQFGGLKKLRQATAQQLCSLSGVGKAKFASLMAALELGLRYSDENLQTGDKLSNTQETQRFLAKRLGSQTREVFAVIFMNNQQVILAFEELFQGGLTETAVYPREILKRGLAHNAAKIILAHNHPSGNPQPSQADKELTWRLGKILAMVEIQLLDHVIIGEGVHFSFADVGWL